MGIFSPLARHRFSSRPRLGTASGLLAFSAVLGFTVAAAAEPKVSQPNTDWPCRQILVPRLSLATVWSGPSIEGSHWRSDPTTADLVAKLAARRTSLEEAEHSLEDFAKTNGSEKGPKLVAVFAGLFETLNDERAQVIDGLLRFGTKQKELAEKIRAENAAIREKPAKTSAEGSGQNAKVPAQNLEWDLRIFEERQKSLTYACEAPTLIEQRLFALARVIQSNLE
jgi:hypothetical protein